MCETHASDERLLLIHDARAFADALAVDLRVPVTKATDIASPAGFDRAVALLAARFRRVTRGAEAKAVRAALQVLDVDWHRTTPEVRRRLITAALSAAGRAISIVPSQIRAPLEEVARTVASTTRTDVRRIQGLAIAAAPNAFDRRVTAYVVRSHGNFVRDAEGRRLEGFGEAARRIVAAGLEQGLGQSDIAGDLERAAEKAFVARSPFYWEVVASAFIAQGRAFGQMSAYAEAGIRHYRIEAVLDEQTTHICRYLHGKTFAVRDAMQRLDRVMRLAEPERIKRVLPWVREATDPETGVTRLYAHGEAGRVDLADVTRSAVGARDNRGTFQSLASDSALTETGIGFPPYHGLCRSTTLAVV